MGQSIHIYKAFFVYILSKEILLKLDQGKAQLHKMSLQLPKKAKPKKIVEVIGNKEADVSSQFRCRFVG